MNTMTVSPMQFDHVTKKEFEIFQGEVKNRFDSVDNRFDKVDNRFNSVDNKFKSIDNRFDNIDNKLDRLKIEICDQTRSDMETWREKVQYDFKTATEILKGQIESSEKRLEEIIKTELSNNR